MGLTRIGKAAIGKLATALDADGNDVQNAGKVDLADAGQDPSENGEITRNGQDVKIQSGGSVQNLANMGTVQNPLTQGLDLDANKLLNEGNDLLTFGSGGEPQLYSNTGTQMIDFGGSGVAFGSGVPVILDSGGQLRTYWYYVENIASGATPSSGDVTIIDTSSSSQTATLPSNPSEGAQIRIVKAASGNTLTIDRNGNEIDGATSNISLSALAASRHLVWDGNASWWTV